VQVNSLVRPSYKQGIANRATSVNSGLWSGLVGSWVPGLGNTGTTVFDQSGRKNNATITGATWTIGDNSNVLRFTESDGTNKAVISHSDALNVSGANQSFSVVVRFKIISVPDAVTYALLHKGTGASSRPFQLFYHKNDDQVYFQLYDGTNNPKAQINSASSVVSDGEWHTIVGVRDVAASQMRIYLDGKDTTDASTNTAFDVDFNDTGDVSIGDTVLDMDSWLDAEVSAAFVYNRVLSDNEIRLLNTSIFALFIRNVVFFRAPNTHVGTFSDLGAWGVPYPENAFEAKAANDAPVTHTGEFTALGPWAVPLSPYLFEAKTANDAPVVLTRGGGGATRRRRLGCY
jgi:hypothetical protein